jgi:excisionase family DNA binding protein
VECQQIKDELVKFVDNELSDEMREVIQAHLDNCGQCSKELESILTVTKLCQNLKDISPSRNWKMKLRRKLENAQKDPSTEMEMLKGMVISLGRRIQEMEESYLSPFLESDIMTIEDLARYLRLSVDQVYDMIDHIPKIQLGYEFRFRKESIDQWIRYLEGRSPSREYSQDNWSQEEE